MWQILKNTCISSLPCLGGVIICFPLLPSYQCSLSAVAQRTGQCPRQIQVDFHQEFLFPVVLKEKKGIKNKNQDKKRKKICRNPGSNQGPLDLQSNALPTELFRQHTRLNYKTGSESTYQEHDWGQNKGFSHCLFSPADVYISENHTLGLF